MTGTTTDRDALSAIVRAIEANGTARAEEYDLAGILRETHAFDYPRGYHQTATSEEFWESVQRNEKAPALAG